MNTRELAKKAVRHSRIMKPLLDAFVDVLEPVLKVLRRDRRWIAVETEDDGILLYRVKGRTVTAVGRGDAIDSKTKRQVTSKGQDIELLLPTGNVILATFSIPVDAVSFSAQIVGNRLDRLTPWPPEALLYAFTPAAEPDAAGQIDIAFVATSREIVAGSLARLGALGITPTRVAVADGQIGRHSRIDLLGGANDDSRRRRRRRIAFGAGTAFILSILCFAVSLFVAADATERLDTENAHFAAIRRRLVTGAGLSSGLETERALLAGKTVEEARFHLIDRLAILLPDDTVLDELDIQPGTLRLAGSSAQAPALIAILEAEPGFAEATFAAPLTRQDDGGDRFDIAVSRNAVSSEGQAEVRSP